jgi:hypothetical protein
MSTTTPTTPTRPRNVLIDETWTHPHVARWMYESGQSDAAGIAA